MGGCVSKSEEFGEGSTAKNCRAPATAELQDVAAQTIPGFAKSNMLVDEPKAKPQPTERTIAAKAVQSGQPASPRAYTPSYKVQAIPKEVKLGEPPEAACVLPTPEPASKSSGLVFNSSGVATPSPSPVSQAPPGVVPPNPELQYAPPYIPLPNGPEPEYPEDLPPAWCPARQRAVLVGCNYVEHPDIMLRGCVNDVNCLKHMLITRFGYQADNIILLQDQQPYPQYLPTKANIVAALRWLMGDDDSAHAGSESLFFAFAGHGLRQVPAAVQSSSGPPAGKENIPQKKTASSERGEHVSRRALAFGDWEETILPCDYDVAGSLTGSELYAMLVGPLRKNQRLHCCIDACQSGFSADLPNRGYIRADSWAGWEKVQASGPAPLRDPRINRQPRRIGAVYRGTAGGEAIMLATSPDDDFDSSLSQADASNFRMHASTGAIAFALIQAVEQGQASTYTKLLRAMKYAGKNGPTHLNKMPELSSSHVFNLSRPFVL